MPISVLVVEDQAALRKSIQELLSNAGYDVRCAATEEEAIGVLNDLVTPPCLVLWDPVTLKREGLLIPHAARNGVHVATIPVEVSSAGPSADGLFIVKKLTSLKAILSVVRAHCPQLEENTVR
jgi:CheY-like chemotaxis protein